MGSKDVDIELDVAIAVDQILQKLPSSAKSSTGRSDKLPPTTTDMPNTKDTIGRGIVSAIGQALETVPLPTIVDDSRMLGGLRL